MRDALASSAEVRDLAILCPTGYEARALRRAARVPRSLVMVTGPGADAVRRAVARVRDRVDRVLLVGLAGGLDPSVSAGAAYAVRSVRSFEGRGYDAPWVLRGLPTAALVTAPAIVESVAAKSELAARSGAALVDLEGFAFAEQASMERLRWGIVRAVSDGHDQELPPGIGELVSPRGRTRHLRAAIWMLVNRPRLGDLPTIVGNSWAGLELAGRAVREAIDDPRGGRR